MPFAKTNGIDLYYEVHGDGPPVVFAHGAGGSHLSWWQQVPALSQEFRCVTFDHRGFGLSRDLSDGPGPNSFVEDLRALLDHLGIERAAVVGQSMGGRTVLGFASAYPKRTSALVICDSDGGIDDAEVIREQERLAGSRRGSLAQILSNAYAPDFPTREPARFFLYRQISGLNLHVPPNLLQVRMKHRPEPVVEHRIPTMVLVGAEDALCPPSVMELIARRIQQARFVKVPGAGHSVYFEKPEEFNRVLGDFLREAKVA
jgi:3-oxoadipate enol-lactonase